jgi:ABC-2 type transport system ATP-binding protein
VADLAIQVSDLRKSYGRNEAVRGIDLEVPEGAVFAFLGPNGAGKTTTVEILEGYRDRTSGAVQVLGVDPAAARRSWRERIGIVLQQVDLQPLLTVRETLSLYAGYFANPRPVDETIGLVGLADKADDRVGRLSGGQKRRVDVGIALIGDPELLFLDEPTTGFDPTARRQAWDVIANLRTLGKTILLTTHYMDEAQALADEVAIIARGEIVARGAPAELGGRGKAETQISFRLPNGLEAGELPPAVAAAVAEGARDRERLVVATPEPVPVLHALTSWALERQVVLLDLEVKRPSLEDVYLELTGDEI